MRIKLQSIFKGGMKDCLFRILGYTSKTSGGQGGYNQTDFLSCQELVELSSLNTSSSTPRLLGFNSSNFTVQLLNICSQGTCGLLGFVRLFDGMIQPYISLERTICGTASSELKRTKLVS